MSGSAFDHHGHGITKENMQKLFIPFSTTKGVQGTGPGLSLAKRIVDRHHGKIRVRSSVRPDRCGTTFRISLPD